MSGAAASGDAWWLRNGLGYARSHLAAISALLRVAVEVEVIDDATELAEVAMEIEMLLGEMLEALERLD